MLGNSDNQKPVLVIMAAGMGSHYGGLKQIDPVGNHGQLLLDYSLLDAYRAGFRTVIFVIKMKLRKHFVKQSVIGFHVRLRSSIGNVKVRIAAISEV